MSIIATGNRQELLSPSSDNLLTSSFSCRVTLEVEVSQKRSGSHRLFLAGVLSVLLSRACSDYGPMKKTAEEIKVEDNFEAFETMIKYIYKPPSSEPFKVSTRAQLGL